MKLLLDNDIISNEEILIYVKKCEQINMKINNIFLLKKHVLSNTILSNTKIMKIKYIIICLI
jgi:hypothetical protein